MPDLFWLLLVAVIQNVLMWFLLISYSKLFWITSCTSIWESLPLNPTFCHASNCCRQQWADVLFVENQAWFRRHQAFEALGHELRAARCLWEVDGWSKLDALMSPILVAQSRQDMVDTSKKIVLYWSFPSFGKDADIDKVEGSPGPLTSHVRQNS